MPVTTPVVGSSVSPAGRASEVYVTVPRNPEGEKLSGAIAVPTVPVTDALEGDNRKKVEHEIPRSVTVKSSITGLAADVPFSKASTVMLVLVEQNSV